MLFPNRRGIKAAANLCLFFFFWLQLRGRSSNQKSAVPCKLRLWRSWPTASARRQRVDGCRIGAIRRPIRRGWYGPCELGRGRPFYKLGLVGDGDENQKRRTVGQSIRALPKWVRGVSDILECLSITLNHSASREICEQGKEFEQIMTTAAEMSKASYRWSQMFRTEQYENVLCFVFQRSHAIAQQVNKKSTHCLIISSAFRIGNIRG